jgi:hypothetical protein
MAPQDSLQCSQKPYTGPELIRINPVRNRPKYSFFTVSNKVRVRVTFRLTVCQPVCLGVEPRPELMVRY